MARIRHTKNELKKQRDALKRYNRYLPTLLLKKQQLRLELVRIHQVMEEIKQEKAYIKALVYKWADVFTEKTEIEKMVQLRQVVTSIGNIAGVDVPVFTEIMFEETMYDFMKTPLWVDYAIKIVKKVITLNAKMEILKRQESSIREELRITTQRVNLFEKVMIPQGRENIRKIQISLGDMQTAAVVTGKIAKEKILRNS
ncbi:MAG: V-type ATP synthase subunit D [Candidatus Omnitrophota bacterium]